MSFKNLHQCLNPNIQNHISLSERLTDKARQILPPQLAKHCWVSGYENETLRLVTDQGAFSTIIAFHQEKLLDCINQEFGGELAVRLRKVSVRVAYFPVTTQVHR